MPPKRQRNIQSRSFTGCGACRKRHLKCNELRPVCTSCQRLGLPCVRDTNLLHWLPGASSGGAPPSKQHHRAQQTQAYRYPLYSEGRRETLAAELIASTKGRPAANLIARLDAYCFGHDDQRLPNDYHDGPFGVFDTRHACPSTAAAEGFTGEDEAVSVSPQCSATVAAAPSTDIEAIERTLDLGALISSFEDPPSNESVEEIEEIRNVYQGDSPFATALVQDSSEHDFWHMEDSLSFMDHLNSPPGMLGGDFMGFDNMSFEFPTNGFTAQLNSMAVAPRSPTPPPTNADWSHLLTEAPVLLRYYQNEGNASGLAKQSFWRSFVLPSAMRTFAELTVFGQASNLSSSIFYSTIANSAFAMQRSDLVLADDSHWYAIGQTAEKAARHGLQNALQSPQPDCRELLTATLSLALVSLYHHPEKAMNHLIEAERLIRQRGPNSTHNTFQYRALIHVYAYYRIIMESICFATGKCIRGTSNGSLERFSVTEDTLEVGLDPAVQKTSEVGYNDIHLDFHGKWQETLYTKIYGVPETLLTMLSQTVKLANGKQRLESVAVSSKHVSDALRRHTKRLERNIWTLCPRDDIPNDDQSPTSHLVLAVHQAIIVYFYRQVQKVDAMILQGSVRKALDHLEPCIAELEHGHDLTFLVAWAAFVVACEAATDGLQKRSLDCLTQIEACASFFIIRRMSDVAKRVWEHRERTDDWTVSWLDVA